MSLELNNITSGYSTGLINYNFQTLGDYINSNLLNRDGTEVGEANQMELPLDMNSNPILNASTDLSNPRSLITVGDADGRYVNVTGDVMEGSLNMASYPITVRLPVQANEPARKDQLDQESLARLQGDAAITSGYQAGDANLQAQLTGNVPLEASAFSPVSWHDQVVENSVIIPENKNAWSFGPTMAIASGQAVTVSNNSFWTITN